MRPLGRLLGNGYSRAHAPTEPPGPLEDPEDLMFTDDDGYEG